MITRTIIGIDLIPAIPEPFITEGANSKFVKFRDDNFSRKQKLRILTQKPIKFHQSHDTLVKRYAVRKLQNKPNQKPIKAKLSLARLLPKIAIVTSANIGPLTIDPILFTASSTVGAIFST